MKEIIEVRGISSETQAKHVLDAIAVRENYKASSIENDFMVYEKGDLEVTIKKVGTRRFNIVKRVKTNE
jgi:hypothetical protein